MPRKKIILTDKFPYHVYNRSNHKQWFSIPMQNVWRIALDSLEIAHKKHSGIVHAFVLMSNHYHLIISTPRANLSDFMYEFSKNFSLKLRSESNQINKMFGSRYKWSLIEEQRHYYQVMKYVFLNPNKAGIINDVTMYPYSSLHYQKYELPFPMPIRPNLNTLDQDFLKWVHEEHDEKQRESIGLGLRRSKFRYSGTREMRRPPAFTEFDPPQTN